MSTGKNRHTALESFVKCFNLCYPSWCVYGSEDTDLEPRHVDFDTSLHSYVGRCGPRSFGRVYFRVNPEWWKNSTNGERVGLLIHELGHVQDTNHTPEFWDQVVENYRALSNHKSEVESALGAPVDWQDVREFLVSDPSNGSVDNRREIAYERRREIAEAVNYAGDVTPFEQMRILTLTGHGDEYERVEFERLEFDDHGLEEVLALFHENGTGVSMDEKDFYSVDPPVVNERDGHYVVVDGSRRAELINRAILDDTDRTTLPVKVEGRL